jgi:hypothetical protein
MSKELNESMRNELIQILNHNIRLEEAVAAAASTKKKKEDAQSGTGDTSQEPETPTHSAEDILLGNKPSKTPYGPKLGLGDVAAIAAGGKVAGAAGQLFGGKLAQKATDMFGGKQASKLAGTAIGDFFSKAMADAETLSGAPGLEAQIADIAPQQVRLRWEGAGNPGWFRPLVPKTSIKNAESKTADEQADDAEEKQYTARRKRIADAELAKREKDLGLPPLPKP